MTSWIYTGLAGFIAGALFAFIPMEKMYLSYKATVEAVGAQQEKLSKEIAARHKQIKETLDAKYKALVDRDAVRIQSLRVQLADLSNASLLSPRPSGTSVSGRICYTDPDKFAREISDALNEAAAEDFGDSQAGQRGIDVASQAHESAVAIGTQ